MKSKSQYTEWLMDINSYDLPSAKRSRWMYIFECTFEYFVIMLITGAYLAKLLSNMGIPDATVGIISSILSLAFISQLISIFFVQKIKNVKKTVVPIHIIGQLLFASLYLLPFLNLPTKVASLLVGGGLLFGYLCNYSVATIIYKWGNRFVNPAGRASFAATKDIIGLSTGMAASLGTSWLFERICDTKGDHVAFIFLSVLILIYIVADLICLMSMTNVKQEQEERAHTLGVMEVMKMLFSNKSFLCVVCTNALWYVAIGFYIGFIGIYEIKDLGMDLTLIAAIGIGSSFMQMAFSKPIARYTDNRSYARGMRLGFTIAAVAMLCVVFTTPKTWWMIIVYALTYSSAMAGVSQNFNNIAFSYVDAKYYVEAVEIKNSISGICGFVTSLIGAAILDAVQKNGNQLFGIKVYGQQVLALIAFVIVVFNILFTKFVLEKRPIIAK